MIAIGAAIGDALSWEPIGHFVSLARVGWRNPESQTRRRIWCRRGCWHQELPLAIVDWVFETLCAEAPDSLSWLRFCRIPLRQRAPRPSTLMKIIKRIGQSTIGQLNAAPIDKTVEAGVVEVSWLRAETIVVPADINCPTDSGMLTKGCAALARLVGRIRDVGVAQRTALDDPTETARRHAHRVASNLHKRKAEAKGEVLAVTGELADLAESVVAQAKRVLKNAKLVEDRPVRRLRSMLADLEHLIDAVAQIITQTSLRLAGVMPESKTRRVSLFDGDARPIRKGSLAKPTQFGSTG